MRRKLSSLGLAFGVTGAAIAMMAGSATARAEDLLSVVQEALASHPELAAIRFNRRAIDHELTAARGLRLPTVDARADAGRHRDYNKSAIGIVTGDEYHRHREAQVMLSQRLFDGFEARREGERQVNRVESARWRVHDTANSIALRVVQAYLEVMRARSVLTAARANLAAHQSLMGRVGRRVDAGRGNSSDRSEAVGRTAYAQALVVEAEARLADAVAFYRSVAGHAPGKLQPVNVPSRALPHSIDVAVAEAREASPSVIATTHDALAADAAVGVAHSRFYPRVNAELSHQQGWGMSESDDRTTDTRAMVVVRWNLFNGGIDKARVWEAKARALEAVEINENTRRIVERETRVSWNAIQAAVKRVPALSEQLRQTRATRAAYSAQFDGGQRRLLDLLNVQAEVFVAEASLRSEEFARVYNSYRLLAAVGRLVPALGLDLPPEAVVPHAPRVTDGWRDGWTNWRTDLHWAEPPKEAAKPAPAK